MYRLLLIAVWAAAPLTYARAADAVVKPPQASDASARAPEMKYDSAFTGYQPFREQKLAPWRELNDEVHKAGGHIGIVGGASGARPPVTPHAEGHKK